MKTAVKDPEIVDSGLFEAESFDAEVRQEEAR